MLRNKFHLAEYLSSTPNVSQNARRDELNFYSLLPEGLPARSLTPPHEIPFQGLYEYNNGH